jgi:hypothetical protein
MAFSTGNRGWRVRAVVSRVRAISYARLLVIGWTRQLRQHDLEGPDLAKTRVHCLVNRGHATATEHGKCTVLATDQRSFMPGSGFDQGRAVARAEREISWVR